MICQLHRLDDVVVPVAFRCVHRDLLLAIASSGALWWLRDLERLLGVVLVVVDVRDLQLVDQLEALLLEGWKLLVDALLQRRLVLARLG